MVSDVRSCDLAKPGDFETIGIAYPVEPDFVFGNSIMAEQVYLKCEIIPNCYRVRVGSITNSRPSRNAGVYSSLAQTLKPPSCQSSDDNIQG